ncbi:MAG: GNAT family N-acetyltransferase [Coriobacteriia bacterium]|nr:GNAT family N-acetyltransferase [Coriobacteriia bacterium]
MADIRFVSTKGSDAHIDEISGLDIFKTCGEIRYKVFIEEQGFEVEFDDIDASALHVLMFLDGKPIGAGRIYSHPTIEDAQLIGRVVLAKEYRGQGLGSVLFKGLEDFAEGPWIYLHAQENKKGFYEKMGYEWDGAEPDYEEFMKHIWMKKKLK